jgi:hypothetical protein
VLDLIATIQDPAWRARALLSAAGELATAPSRALADRALREAEALLGSAPTSTPARAQERMGVIAQPWLPYAYARLGDARAGPALAAVLESAELPDLRTQRVLAYATIVAMISLTRLHIAEDSAGAAAPTPAR